MKTSKTVLGALLLALGIFFVSATAPDVTFAKRNKAKLTAQEKQAVKAKRADKRAQKKARKAELRTFKTSLSSSLSASDKSKAVKAKKMELRKKYAKK